VPGIYVDYVVVSPPEHHRQTTDHEFNPLFLGEVHEDAPAIPVLPLDERKVIARRAALELFDGALVNLGIGMPEGVAAVAFEEGVFDRMNLTVESGTIGGVPAGGLSFGLQVGKSATVFVDGALEDISYDHAGETTSEVYMPGYDATTVTEIPDRSAQTYSIGLGLENTFSPNLMGRIRAGYSAKEMDAANMADDDSPYGELSVTIAPKPTTRLTLGAGYSMYQSGLTTFANQQRTTLSANLAHDLTAKITLSLVGQYYMSDYDSESSVDVVDAASVADGTETAITVGARASFAVTRNNYVDVGYTYTQFDSDFTGRVDVERNRVDLGWRIRM